MKTALMGIGFVMGVSLTSSCVFGETSQKRLDGYNGAELKQALDEVINRLTGAGYEVTPGSLKYEFSAQHTVVTPEDVPLTEQLEDLQKDLNQWGQKIDGLVKELNLGGPKVGKNETTKNFEKLSEKKQAFVRCVKFKAGLEGTTLSEEDRKSPVVKKCLEILGDVETGNPLPYYNLGGKSGPAFLVVFISSGVTIDFPDNTRIEISPDGKIETIELPGSGNDDWFYHDEFDAKYGGKNFAANKPDGSDETDSINSDEAGGQPGD